MQNVEKYREWLSNRLHCHFQSDSNEFDQVILNIYKEIARSNANNKHSRILFGFLGCITKLCHSYRWGIAPLTNIKVLQHKQYELEHGLVSFPKYLLDPWYIMTNFYGLPLSGTTSSVLYANIDYLESYDNVEALKERQDQIRIRYHWTDITLFPKERETENYSFLLFAQSVVKTEPLLRAISEALKFAMQCQSVEVLNERETEKKYIALLDEVEKAYVCTTDHFGTFIRTKIDGKRYIENVSGLAAWNLGARGGASAAEQFLSQVIDRFLGITTINVEAHRTMLATQRALIQKLEHSVALRDKIIPIQGCSKAIKHKFYRIISRVKGWRINHRNKIHKILKDSGAVQSATGNLQVSVGEGSEGAEGTKCPFGFSSDSKHKKVSTYSQLNDISEGFWKSMSENIEICEKVRNEKFNYKKEEETKSNWDSKILIKTKMVLSFDNIPVNLTMFQWIIIIFMVSANIYLMFMQ